MTKKLLIITQKVDLDDDVLGFFHEWIRGFAGRFESVVVICLKVGRYDLPANVRVLSLGKEKGASKLKYLRNFYKYIFSERNNYQTVFVHMNPRYVILGGVLWKLWSKKITLWYAHGHVNFMLKLANLLADIVFTSTAEGYRLANKRTRVVGQGIDTEKFKPEPNSRHDSFKIITVGRISPSKDYETLIDALNYLRPDANFISRVLIIGGPATERDKKYLEMLKVKVEKNNLNGLVDFAGPIANKDLAPLLQSADLFVNLGLTGSLDKAILEAMACGLPVLTCNEALASVLGEYSGLLMYPKKDFHQLAEKINLLRSMSGDKKADLSSGLRKIVVEKHNLIGLVDKISNILTQ